MAITLCRRTRFAVWDGRRAWRNHHFDLIVVCGDRLVGGRAVGRHLNNRIVNLIEERADLQKERSILPSIDRPSAPTPRAGLGLDIEDAGDLEAILPRGCAR
jgi:hypothetical protein